MLAHRYMPVGSEVIEATALASPDRRADNREAVGHHLIAGADQLHPEPTRRIGAERFATGPSPCVGTARHVPEIGTGHVEASGGNYLC